MARKPPVKKIARKIKARIAQLDKGKAAYAASDALLEEVIGMTKVGDLIELGAGFQAEIVDNYAQKNKVWKPCGINRFDIKVTRQAPA